MQLYSTNYRFIEKEISVYKYQILSLWVYLQYKRSVILVYPSISWTLDVKQYTIFFWTSQLPCSLTRLDKCFISKFLPSSGMVTDLNENTRLVLQFIQKNPGCHMRQIQRELTMAMGTIQYHLNALEEMGRIVSERADSHRFYFPVGSFGALERNILKILNHDSAREILLFIIERKNPTQTDIVNGIKISSGTANWHLTRLLSYGVISQEREGKFKRYMLNGRPDAVIKLLQNYHTSSWNKWSNKLAELFLSISPQEEEE